MISHRTCYAIIATAHASLALAAFFVAHDVLVALLELVNAFAYAFLTERTTRATSG